MGVYFNDTSIIFSNFIITYRETFYRSDLICIGRDRQTYVIDIDWVYLQYI